MPMYKKTLVALLFIAVAVLGGTIYGSYNSDNVTKLDSATLSKADKVNKEERNDKKSSTDKIFVYVTGAVNKPGMVELEDNKDGVRISNAVDACGGLLPTADLNSLNMAEKIQDGQHIRIPEKNIDPPADNNSDSNNISKSSNKTVVNNDNIVNINTATAEELQTLNGIGPKMAERIIEHRKTNGAFKSIEEIKKVRGIGDKKFEKFKDHIKT